MYHNCTDPPAPSKNPLPIQIDLNALFTRDEKVLVRKILDHRRNRPRTPLNIRRLAYEVGWSEASVYRKLNAARRKLEDRSDWLFTSSGFTAADMEDPFLQMLYNYSTNETPSFTDHLTEREFTIFQRLTDMDFTEMSLLQQAKTLSISPRTLNKHFENIYRKLGVTNRASATILAMQAKNKMQGGLE